jgi:uncharacterized membrane protein
MLPMCRLLVLAALCLALVVFVMAPLIGFPDVIRLPAILVPIIVLTLVVERPWRWDHSKWVQIEQWVPHRRTEIFIAAVLFGILYWCVLTRFQSASINAVDFTVYFDRPCFQTVNGRVLFVESADVPTFANRSQLAVHATWIMVPLCGLYWLWPTPHWLLILSVAAIIAGAIYVMRILRHFGVPSILAVSAAVAFALNDNTARTLNYGFHIEVLYAWFVPWLLDAGLRRAPRSFVAATIACVSVKEDAVFATFAVGVSLAIFCWKQMSPLERALYIVFPTALAFLNLAFYYLKVIPMLVPDGRPTYGAFWANYGPTPLQAAKGMLMHPVRVINDAVTSGFFTNVLPPHLFLPLVGWRWFIGAVPVVVLYGASTNPQLRAFGIYYAIVLVPFLTLSSVFGAIAVVRLLKRIRCPHTFAGMIIVMTALLVGSTRAGYSLRPWRSEIGTLKQILEELHNEPVVLVQSSLYPHAGYSSRIKLLTPHALTDPQNVGAALVIAPALGSYPLSRAQANALLDVVAARSVDGVMVGRVTPEICNAGFCG